MVGLDPSRRRKSRWYGVTIRPPRRRETSSRDTIIVRNEPLGLSIDCETATAHWHGERIDYDHALMVSMASWDSGDTDMALRILGYVVELYRDLEAQGVVRPGTRRPPVLPVVVHNGESPWRAPVQVAELIALPRVPAQVRRDLRALQPSQRLHVVDFPRYRQDDLVPGNVVSLQIGFEHAGPSDYVRLLPAVGELEDARLRRTVWEWHALHSGGFVALGAKDLVQPSARFTACGSRSMILSSVRAGPVGLRRPCSQFSRVRLLTFRNVAI